jgi:hypothetical protein
MLLEEFDFERSAVIEPWFVHQPVEGFPETVVSIFHHTLFQRIAEFLGGVKIAETKDVDGHWPVYAVQYKGHQFALYKARLGAPACVGSFEDIIPMGAKRIILLGNCGVLDKSIEDCGIIIPTRAIRDEGTSYHYVPASDYIDVNKKYIPEFIPISADKNTNIDELKDVIFDNLDLVRVYLKPQGRKADMEDPLVIKKGSTVIDACGKLHREFVKNFRHAKVWGTSVKFPGQKVGPDHVLDDGDVLRIILKK